LTGYGTFTLFSATSTAMRFSYVRGFADLTPTPQLTKSRAIINNVEFTISSDTVTAVSQYSNSVYLSNVAPTS
jgi:hypothetical protein